MLTNVNGQSGDECSRISPTTAGNQTSLFFPAVLVSAVGSVMHFAVSVLCSPQRVVDLEKLISLVSEKKPLWDTKDKLYQNRDIATKLWNEVATDMGCEK